MEHPLRQRVIIGFLVIFLMLTLVGRHDAEGAETPEEFYRGKTLIWVYAGDVGSPGDLMIRTIAPFLTKEIGAKVKIEDRKTDEGINYIYHKGTRDGLTLGTKTTDAMIGNEILKAPGVQYETDKFNFIADISPAGKVFQLSPKSPYRTLDALRKAKGLKAGGTSAKGSLAMSSAVMFEVLGLDGKVITGFKGKKDLVLSLARGEVDCLVSGDDSALKDEQDGYVVPFMTTGNKRSALLPHVPALPEFGVKVAKEMEAAFKFVTFAGMAVAMPPGVAPERVEYLRKVFQHLNNDKELQRALEKLTGARKPFATGRELQEDMAGIKADKELAMKIDAVFKKYTAVR